jgi:hypothetical protein
LLICDISAYAGHLSVDDKKIEPQQSVDDLPMFEGQIPGKETNEKSEQPENHEVQEEDDNLTELPLRSPSKVL